MPDRYLATETIPLRWLAKDGAGDLLPGKLDLEVGVRRDSDGKWFDHDGSNQFDDVGVVSQQWGALSPTDAVWIPALYELLWNHALVDPTANETYLIVFRQNGGTDAVIPEPNEITVGQYPGALVTTSGEILANTELLLNSEPSGGAAGLTSVHAVGDTVRLYMDLVQAGAGVISQTPTFAIQRFADGKWFQESDGTWQATKVENAAVQTDSVNLPGRYHLDFDQTLDDLAGSVRYIVSKTNTGTPKSLEYENLLFGHTARVTRPNLCSVQGTVHDAQGEPLPNVLVQATLVPVFKDGFGRIIQSDRVVSVHTNETGDFDLQLVRGGVFKLEIRDVGYARKVTIPDQAQVLFTDL